MPVPKTGILRRVCPALAPFGLCGRGEGLSRGVYVKPAFRGQKIAARLVSACEDWAKQHGCRELASGCELGNAQSLAFHLHAGFSEANRVICFVKTL